MQSRQSDNTKTRQIVKYFESKEPPKYHRIQQIHGNANKVRKWRNKSIIRCVKGLEIVSQDEWKKWLKTLPK